MRGKGKPTNVLYGKRGALTSSTRDAERIAEYEAWMQDPMKDVLFEAKSSLREMRSDGLSLPSQYLCGLDTQHHPHFADENNRVLCTIGVPLGKAVWKPLQSVRCPACTGPDGLINQPKFARATERQPTDAVLFEKLGSVPVDVAKFKAEQTQVRPKQKDARTVQKFIDQQRARLVAGVLVRHWTGMNPEQVENSPLWQILVNTLNDYNSAADPEKKQEAIASLNSQGDKWMV